MSEVLVIDANVAVMAATSPEGFDVFAGRRLVGPPLLASEFRAALHTRLWRQEIHRGNAERAFEMLEAGVVEIVDHPGLGREAWAIAEMLGWARTYDAEYVALARLLGCLLVTNDLKLRRGADRLGLVVTAEEFFGLLT